MALAVVLFHSEIQSSQERPQLQTKLHENSCPSFNNVHVYNSDISCQKMYQKQNAFKKFIRRQR